MRNIELKWRCADLERVRRAAHELGARDAGLIHQDDTFFSAPKGRLKLRDFGNGTGELIAYVRADTAEARASDYQISGTSQPGTLRTVLRYALGEAGRVVKRRHLFLFEHTRIHLDEVEGLGTFVELETVVSEQSEELAREELDRITRALGLDAEERLAPAYVDLLRSDEG